MKEDGGEKRGHWPNISSNGNKLNGSGNRKTFGRCSDIMLRN